MSKENREFVTGELTFPAFVTGPLLLPVKSVPLSPLQRVTPQPRSRCITPSARSLDSYREGMRFRDSSPNDPSLRKRPKPSQTSKISLVKALVKLNVASHDTCEFLVRKGCVRVNGVVVKDDKARVHRQSDSVMVNGTNYGTFDGSLNQSDESVDSDSDETFLPRSQRDFNRGYLDDGEGQRKFSRRVDGGFYSSKKYPYGK